MPTKHTIAQAKYDREHRRNYGFRLHNDLDRDIIEKLSSVPSMQGYVKQLIREDIARTRFESVPKTYHIKPEYYDLWVSSDDTRNPEDIVITEDDIIRLSHDWEVTKISELKDQLIPD